jgi:hypothetical protein
MESTPPLLARLFTLKRGHSAGNLHGDPNRNAAGRPDDSQKTKEPSAQDQRDTPRAPKACERVPAPPSQPCSTETEVTA